MSGTTDDPKTVQINLRIQPDLYECIKADAEKFNDSVSETIRTILLRHYKS